MQENPYKVSDAIAQFLERNQIKHVFGIVGAGNVHIFDAINRRGYTEIICVHHEQAAVMAMGAYYRASGKISASLVTTGAGSTNAVTGVVSCFMDSIPGLIIAGNEKSIHCDPKNNPLRIWGVQGYDSVAMVEKVAKYSHRVLDPTLAIEELEKALWLSLSGRMGPTWIEIPMDIQGTPIEKEKIKRYTPPVAPKFFATPGVTSLEEGIGQLNKLAEKSKRPLLWLGSGVRSAGAQDLIKEIIEKLNWPVLVSWNAIDLVDSDHPSVFGRAGVYGQRASNFVLQNSDFILCIGNRMAIPQIGYEISELARAAQIVCVDIDPLEVLKHKERLALGICADAKEFLLAWQKKLKNMAIPSIAPWMKQCSLYREKFPSIGPEHQDAEGYINSYPFMKMLSDHLPSDEIVVTDMGTALLSGFQVISINKNKRMFTSTGLGEMGYGLPAAIGASLAHNKAKVLCLNCDGGMMMNLQELQTIAHHQLPIRIIVFNNDGYLMIKNTQKGLFKGRFSGTDKASGISCPDFSKIADAFGFGKFTIRTWEDAKHVLPQFLDTHGPVICEVFMDPEQLCVPKLGIALTKEGKIVSPPLEDLSPLLDRAVLREQMIIGLHPKSEGL